MDGVRPLLPPPELPAGWRAVWNDMHEEWFYVNLHTFRTTWDKPTTAATPVSDNSTSLTDSSKSPTALPRMTSGASATSNDNEHRVQQAAHTASSTNTRLQDDLIFEKEILSDYDFEESSRIETSNRTNAWSRKNSCRVLIKRYSKFDTAKVAAAQRELNALHVLGGSDDAIPPLLDYFDPANTVFVVCEDRQDESLRQYVEGRGPLTGDLLKAVVTQLMSALSNIFMNGFAHLKMNDESLFIDGKGQLTVKDFQFAVPYKQEKTEALYGAVDHAVRGAEGIWCAPEVFAAEKEGVEYNGRKAVLWTCGVAVYYMVTGQVERLSNLDHPAFSNRRPSTARLTSNANSNANATVPTTSSPTTDTTPDTTKSRRLSLKSYRRRSSAAGTSTSHSRKSSLVTSIPTPHTLITYPGNRLEIPSYARDIISKMLILNPVERAELIEVASKVPKEFVVKTARPLMELAWLDYKSHVGPYAGLGLGADEWGGGGGADDASSVYSGISALSQSLTGLLSKSARR